MARKRLKPGGERVYHHVMTRTAQQVYWLEDPEVKKILLELVDFYSQVYYVKVLGFVCMSNHYHLCLEISRPELDKEDIRRRHGFAQTRLANPRPLQEAMVDHFYRRYTDLSKFMWEINWRMAMTYNRQQGTAGHLWGGRFKNVVVESGQRLLNVLAYIELNPVRADLATDPADFPYSSVGRIKTKLDGNEPAEAPAIPLLERFPKMMRAGVYLALIRYVAVAVSDPDLRRQPMPLEMTSYGWELDLQVLCDAIHTRAPSRWSAKIYGTPAFTKKTMIDMGWMAPENGSKEVARSGPSGAAA